MAQARVPGADFASAEGTPSHVAAHDEFLELQARHALPAAVSRWAEELAPGPWQARAAICREGEDAEEGGLVALARVSLVVLQEPEGLFYELRVPVPQTRGWGASQRNELAREQALVACVRRLGDVCGRLLSGARAWQGRLPVQFVFSREWDDCLAPLQKMLVRETLAAHLLAGPCTPERAAGFRRA